MSSWQQILDAAIDARFSEMVALRRQLHMYPEVSGEERETSLRLYQSLGDAGLMVRMGPDGRGVVADGAREEKCIALRGDIDALRIHDKKMVEYCSRVDGVMHACGHDAHTAIVWGVTLAIHDLRQQQKLPWPTPLRSIFQPAEETCQGARDMIEFGAIENVSAIFAAHVDPTRGVGKIGLRRGVLTAACDEMQITITGRGGHAARPHETSDPIAAAAQLINALYIYIPRSTDSQDAVVVTIGQVEGGHNANVIPEEVVLRGTIRTLDVDVRAQTRRQIERLTNSLAQTCDVSMKLTFGVSSPSVVNHPSLIETLRRAGEEVVGAAGIENIARASMGSEDFAYYLDHVPGAMIRLGVANSHIGHAALHTPTFDIDEEAMRVGARVLARAIINEASPEAPAA